MTIIEQLSDNLIAGIFLERLNRFVARVWVGNKEELAHVPSSGRMHELLAHGAGVYLTPAKSPKRKTRYSLRLVQFGDTLVSIDSLLPNRLIKSALANGKLPELEQFPVICPEYNYYESRFDFFLTGAGPGCFVEVKSVTLVNNGAALFPDAPSLRGARHLKELKRARENGFKARVIFVVQRCDGAFFSPNKDIDPAFASALTEAADAGVGVYAYSCRVSLDRVELWREIPVHI